MDNKFISLGSKVLMGILLLIGIILIKNNLSYNDSSEEPTLNQELFTLTTGNDIDSLTDGSTVDSRSPVSFANLFALS